MVEGSMRRCSCGEPLEPDWDECPACEKPIPKEPLACPQCGRQVKEKWKKCPYCKSPLGGWATPTKLSDTGAAAASSPPPHPATEDGPYLSEKPGEDDDLGYGVQVIIHEGDALDKYTIRRLLGSGGFGSVYLAEDTYLKEKFALKVVVAGEGNKAQNACEQIIHEFKLREKITDFSHIVSVKDPRTCEHMNLTLVLLPMDFAEGGSFRDWLKKNKGEEARTKEGLKLFRQACLGVKAIHNAGIAHLDVKPENILLVDGTAKIADFGIGRYGASMFADNPQQVNRQGIGTPQYMSPEQFHAARQKDIGPASDIYSLGVVLYELLDGSLPFDGSSREEYRQKHLHDNPTEIKGACARYWGIISRCLAKKADDRYGHIDQLIGDLDRAAQGASLSVDVSCPACGHINSDTSYDICEKCGSVLPDSLFRECRRCMKKLRLDTELCPACGFHVMEYYVLQERWERVQKLKDEDPVEAMELLEVVLRAGAAEHEENALALVRDLRRKQSQIRDLIAEADKATADGQPEKALEAWRRVLDVVPRHRVALEQIQELETLMEDFAGHLADAEKLMDQAQFEDADARLQTCLQLVPQREETRSRLETCRQRAHVYGVAFSQATLSAKQRLLRAAERQVKAALAQAPSSADAIALAEEFSETLKRTKQLVDEAHNQLTHAEFGNVSASICEIDRLQADNESLSELKVQLNQIHQAYVTSMQDAKSTEGARDLGRAAQAAEEALELCPQSSEVRSLLKCIKEDQKKAQKLLDELPRLLPAAKFEDAEALAKQIGNLWATIEGLKEAKDTLAKYRRDYYEHMESSERAKAQGTLEEALRQAELALAVSPESPEAKKSVKGLKERKARAECLLRETIAATRAARFQEADAKLPHVDDLWRGLDGLAEARADLAMCREEFPRLMLATHEAQVGKDLAKALEAGDRAVSICPESQEALALVKSVKSAQSEAEQHLKKAIPAWKTAEFDKARNELSQAEKIWPKVPGLRKAVAELVQAQRRHRLRRIEWSIATVALLVFVYGTARLWLTYTNRRHVEIVSEFAQKGDYAAAITEYDKCLEIPLLVSRPKLREQVIKGMASEHKRKQDYDEAVRQCRDLTDASKTDEARLAAQKALSLANTSLEKQIANALITTITDLEITIRHDDLVKQAQAENNVDRKIELLKNALNAKEVTLTRHVLEQTLEGEAVLLVKRAASENDIETKIGLLRKALQYKDEDYIRREIESAVRFSRPEQTTVGVVRWYTDWQWVVQDRTGNMVSGFVDPKTNRRVRIWHSDGVMTIQFTDNKVDNPTIYGSCRMRAYDHFILGYARPPYRTVLNWSIQGKKHLMVDSRDGVEDEDAFFWSGSDPSLVVQLGDIRYGNPVRKGYPELCFEQNPKFRVGRR